ncbi:TetR family transcriptional regulator [Sinomicrobium weinanense]|uniref:Biofilm operon icaADBC HTH-type negative transcriptional regulator IcaR n=1 Tax=Sinomicrobium weinanense TaxID=2842200 RepID=A0A926Q2G0_9FLAO|nr:TetR family transcriptional regulator [Sinomicrobium weinanense]MBC9796612.1 TetR/AcrR family transcriptional regulator [Sinomicrobium weinanense]MBU3123596.1 TetR family transcriptional regulator [Sinomicrobium weinanense]
MGRKSLTDVRQKEIIRSFYRVARKIGLENTSIAKVADEMGISNGLVMHYFKTRDDLLIGLNEYILERHLNIITSRENGVIDSWESLENLIKNLFSRKWNRYFDDGVFYSCYALIYRKKDFNESFRNYLESLHRVLYDKLKEARAGGVICNENLEELTEIIFALIDGAYYYLGMFTDREQAYEKQVNLYIKHTLSLFITA